MLNELSSDPGLERFRIEYENLYRYLKSSHDNVKKLLKKCRELYKDLIDNSKKVTEVMEMTKNDQQNISFLKKELETNYKLLE